MTNYEFATWMRGFLQLCPAAALNRKRVQIIKNHLNLVVAVEGQLGEKNQYVYDRLSRLQAAEASELEYVDFVHFLRQVYFEAAA